MGSRLKSLRKQAGFKKVSTGRASVAGKDALMLSAAKRAVQQTDDAGRLAHDKVLLVCDMRDEIGAELASQSLGQSVDDLRDAIMPGELPGEANPTPFVATWAPRAILASVLGDLGFGVPADWMPAFARPPRAGWFWILLKRDGKGLLLESDLVGVPELSGPALKVD